MSDFENVCDAVLKGAFYFCLGFLIVILCLVLLVLPIIVLASEGFWALIALEMLARGLTDAGDSWHELIGWALRVPGVAIAPLTVVVPWLAVWVLQNGHHRSREQQMRPPTDLPAAAVSLLKEHEVKGRTLLAIILEMCQRGTLEITGVREKPCQYGSYELRGEYEYRIKALKEPRFSWERTICDALPKVEVEASTLCSRLERRKHKISRQIRSYLRERGLFHPHPMAKANPARWIRRLPWLGALLLGTGLTMWLMYLEGSWVIKVATGIAASTVIGIVYLYGAIKVGRRVLGRSRALPNWSGRYELGLWMRFREHLKSVGGDSADPGQSDDLLSYAVALNIAGPWLNDHTDAPARFQVASAWSARKLPRSRRRAYHGLMSSECWGLKGRSERAEGWAMEMV